MENLTVTVTTLVTTCPEDYSGTIIASCFLRNSKIIIIILQSKEYMYRNTVPLTSCFFFFSILILTEHWDKIKEYKHDRVHDQGFFYDICCGKVYQQTPGKYDPEKLISLVYHIVGAPAVKSKTMNLWPMQCFVVELPTKLRYCFPKLISWFLAFPALQKNQV